MEQKHILLSALSAGVGLGLGLRLASGPTVSKWAGYGSSEGITGEQIEQELLRLVVDGKESKITFDEFPYFLRDHAEIFGRLSMEVYPGDVGDLVGEIAIWRVFRNHRCRGGEDLAMGSFHVWIGFWRLIRPSILPRLKDVGLVLPRSRGFGDIAWRSNAEMRRHQMGVWRCASEQTRVLLTSAAYVHLKHLDVSKYTRNLSPASRAILLSGPAELYQQMLAKALAHHFEAKLLLLDVTDFSLKMQSKYGSAKKDSSIKRSISEVTLERMSSLLGSISIRSSREDARGTLCRQNSGLDIKSRSMEGANDPPRPRRNSSTSSDLSSISSQSSSCNTAPPKRMSNWSFDEKLFLQSLFKVLVSVSGNSSIILYIRDVERLFLQSQRLYKLFDKMLKKLLGSIIILGSRILDSDNECREVEDRLSLLFPYNIVIKPPEDESHLESWKAQLEEDMKVIQFQDNKNHIAEVLAANDLECDDLGSICHADTMVLSNHLEEIVVSAISYHLMNNKDPEYRNGKLVISSKSLSHGLSIFQEGKMCGKDTLKLETNAESSKDGEGEEIIGSKPEAKAENKNETEKTVPSAKKDGENSTPAKEVPPDNEFEKRIRPEVIPANEIGVTFADIGALDEIKESLQELVMLPLRRPDLFKGGLLKPCRGILLFGPPGTGKTMLAKAIANEAGASFINVSMSTITSKWFGEDEKNVRALFTLAAKVSPTIIFVDEVDSMLGQRTRVGEHEAMRKIKNEFMAHWDGLLTKPGERILVLAATNRPFDLDEAIIRRFERRIMVGLPSVESREMILKTLLGMEKVENLDFKELATMTEGYSGSDLKKKKQKAEEGQSTDDASDPKEEGKEERVITLRPLNMEDMRQAKNQVAASFAAEGSIMGELKQWNDLYGEGGSRKKQQLTYFL
ncbi:P-loop containing nucleoside triphosphate hydrolases superfamily protein [Actinidia rufa]|uniref:P-loop containing nucleoside triphosphate hydrolases superfamily protein n=1 Tax=Actinidia rufa TaxID=165716 RepID=A0A7J0EA81_9ERIC|nr:P-loop containing nucleoside triphosphate hydrolases superfamily protein [Actinidia rufa]